MAAYEHHCPTAGGCTRLSHPSHEMPKTAATTSIQPLRVRPLMNTHSHCGACLSASARQTQCHRSPFAPPTRGKTPTAMRVRLPCSLAPLCHPANLYGHPHALVHTASRQELSDTPVSYRMARHGRATTINQAPYTHPRPCISATQSSAAPHTRYASHAL